MATYHGTVDIICSLGSILIVDTNWFQIMFHPYIGFVIMKYFHLIDIMDAHEVCINLCKEISNKQYNKHKMKFFTRQVKPPQRMHAWMYSTQIMWCDTLWSWWFGNWPEVHLYLKKWVTMQLWYEDLHPFMSWWYCSVQCVTKASL